jgi:hypothetical protein
LVYKYKVNTPIIEALKALARPPEADPPLKYGRLSYVPGNHDMLVCSPEFFDFKDEEENGLTGMRFWGKNAPGWYKYYDVADEDGHNVGSQIVAEHGHDYEPFDAMNNWTLRPSYLPSHLPIGFYFSRVVAQKVAIYGEPENEMAILAKCFETMLPGLLKKHWHVVEETFLATAKDAKMGKYATINVGADVTIPVYVCDIGAIYCTALQEWDQHNPTKAPLDVFARKGLAECVRRQYFTSRPGPRIAICGHTHVPMIKSWRDAKGFVSYIYANCGAWTDSARQCTYVETERDPEQNRHYVRLKAYSRDGVSTTITEQYVPLK